MLRDGTWHPDNDSIESHTKLIKELYTNTLKTPIDCTKVDHTKTLPIYTEWLEKLLQQLTTEELTKELAKRTECDHVYPEGTTDPFCMSCHDIRVDNKE